MKKVLPVLIDFDGIIRIGKEPAGDAKEFLQFLSRENIPSIILSNSTLMTGDSVKDYLQNYEIDFGISCITTADASLEYIKSDGIKVSVYCNESVKRLFDEFTDDNNPDAVLIGDLENKWSYDILNDIFRKVYNGADIIAMQKNKFWKPAGEPALDAGAFIAAIEYASGKKATLIGKPSPLYFEIALKKLGFDRGQEFIMIGDDIENDIEGAQKIYGKGYLVFTGKTKFPLPDSCRIKPDLQAQSLTEVITHLQSDFT